MTMREGVIIRRSAAFGDAIMASAVCSRLHEIGQRPFLACVPEVAEAFKHHPHLQTCPVNSRFLVDLDGCYENHPDRKNRRIIELMAEQAFAQLTSIGIRISGLHNLTPTLVVSNDELGHTTSRMSSFSRPWITVGPRSNSWRNKTVHRSVWEGLEANGTMFWLGTDPAPAGYVDLQCRSFRQLMAFIAASDLCVSTDSGPLHAAAALKVPTVAIEQAFSIERHILGKQTDWTGVGAEIECLGCCEQHCPLVEHGSDPLCMFPDRTAITNAINDKLETVSGGRISAIIPVYRPDPRLYRCIMAVVEQVDEVIISLDASASMDGFSMSHSKVRIIPNPTGKRTGCGHTIARAVRHARGRYLLLLNDDAYADPGSVKRLTDAMGDDVAVVGAKTRYPNGTIYHAGTFRPPGHNGWGHIDHNRPVEQATIKERTEMEFVNLAFALVRREAYFDVRGIDERYDCYSEDNDFCLAVRKAGWRVVYEPSATAIHDESQSTTSDEKRALLADGNAKFMAKWGSYFIRNRNNQMGVFE